MSDIIEKLSEMKVQMDEMKIEKATLTGSLNELNEQLKIDFNCSSVDEAEKLLEAWEKEIVDERKRIETAVEDIEKRLEGIDESRSN